MANYVTVNLPNRPQGSSVVISGLGEFPNGETTELTESQVRLYKARNPDHEGDIELEYPVPPVVAEEKTGSETTEPSVPETTETSDSGDSEPETTSDSSDDDKPSKKKKRGGTLSMSPLEEGE